jgi:hypothetical protein
MLPAKYGFYSIQSMNGSLRASMSQAYIVHEGWFSANVLLRIRREANSWAQDLLQGSFVNVTDMASYYSGAFGMYRR